MEKDLGELLPGPFRQGKEKVYAVSNCRMYHRIYSDL